MVIRAINGISTTGLDLPRICSKTVRYAQIEKYQTRQDEMETLRDCGDCGVTPGKMHEEDCDVARCKNCGMQLFLHSGCDEPENTMWTGMWPGVVECRVLGWYTDENSIWGKTEDLNRHVRALVRGELVWDRENEITRLP
jgi:hypothetical protein